VLLARVKWEAVIPITVKTIAPRVFTAGNRLTRTQYVVYVPHSALEDGAV